MMAARRTWNISYTSHNVPAPSVCQPVGRDMRRCLVNYDGMRAIGLRMLQSVANIQYAVMINTDPTFFLLVVTPDRGRR